MKIPLANGSFLVEVECDDSPEARSYGETVRMALSEDCLLGCRLLRHERATVGLTPEQARQLANALYNAADTGDRLLDTGRRVAPEAAPRQRATATRPYTPRQGQYLAFIYLYTKLNRQPPSELDMQQHFRVSAPSVHQMVVTLSKRGLISREPGRSRTIRVLLPPEELPPLEQNRHL